MAVATEIRTVGVVGLGAMGAGIAQLALEAGYDTVGREVTDNLAEKARGQIGHYLQRKVDKERMSADERTSSSSRRSSRTSPRRRSSSPSWNAP